MAKKKRSIGLSSRGQSQGLLSRLLSIKTVYEMAQHVGTVCEYLSELLQPLHAIRYMILLIYTDKNVLSALH